MNKKKLKILHFHLVMIISSSRPFSSGNLHTLRHLRMNAIHSLKVKSYPHDEYDSLDSSQTITRQTLSHDPIMETSYWQFMHFLHTRTRTCHGATTVDQRWRGSNPPAKPSGNKVIESAIALCLLSLSFFFLVI